jgi:hypothetical protein
MAPARFPDANLHHIRFRVSRKAKAGVEVAFEA